MGKVIVTGAGPAGASLALLLARASIDVTLLERRRDFDREFRGEVLMPSGVDALAQMGVAEQLAQLPGHSQEQIELYLNARPLLSAALSGDAETNIRAVSQPALLEMLVGEAAQFPNFKLLRGASLKALLNNEQNRVSGVAVRTAEDGTVELAADLVIGADGRHSAVRKLLDLTNAHASPPMDIVWCKLPLPDDWVGAKAFAGRGNLLIAYHTWGDMLQLGWVILKGDFAELRSQGMPQWLDEMAKHVTPELAQHLRLHRDSVERPFLLDVVSDCVERWSVPGALVIGDAAHTMSPVGGQGVNVALRDAIVCANQLIPLLAPGAIANGVVDSAAVDRALQAIEQERMPEISVLQQMQAQPPQLVLSRAWWGEPVRRLFGWLIRSSAVQSRALSRAQLFLHGVTSVQLK